LRIVHLYRYDASSEKFKNKLNPLLPRVKMVKVGIPTLSVLKLLSVSLFIALPMCFLCVAFIEAQGTNVKDTYCTNSGSSLCDSIVVEAWISGQSPQNSNGGGRASGSVVAGGICCVITAAARIAFAYHMEGQWIVYYRILDFDGSVSKTFYPAGDMVSTSVEINWCDAVKPSVVATLSGLCIH